MKNSNGTWVSLLLALGFGLASGGLVLTQSASGADTPAAATKDLVPLDLKLPIPAFMGTPVDIPLTDNIEKPSDKPRPPFMVPNGVVNAALSKKVTCSDKNPITGSVELVTDGDKESNDNSFLELHRRLQWVQIDLGSPYAIYVIMIWHAHNTPQIYRDVVVQVSDDPDFSQNVQTVFNNDRDNSAGLGIGKDKEYFESYEGKLIDAKGVKGRYVRLYSNGSTYSALNRYTEVEVYSLPAK
ncbi:MAG: discoidin domain-containing protein [Candidatus Omnitrophica bacterium]|nr:discoidin domain-containing protein [Candidatus Omnitrophota bacterium]